ncbi:MAG: dTDP-4-dehydrorhamnose reductase [Kordiimonadaceae bacterium]|nr:dTDP-4-dehydrorhamnose reductase [Kordiimonadaceae bacterium]MBO6569479.1 dTDP-4-dehydrorhamnose reductase [Kordiimonadaceae bacterium]MBO6964954.1 dTDP-4-dehydrorhamnose reductase [Kordiimonadaceae bacterium]
MIFVAGKSGQVARSLEEAAVDQGLHLQAYGRPELDIASPESIEAVVMAANPAAIINAAAYTAVDQAESEEELATKVNADGPAALASVAAKLKVPFLHISTDYVFDGSKASAYVETDPVGPTGAYGRSKLAGEKAVLAANPRAIILRTAWVYSPFGKNFLKTMLSLAGRDRLTVVADQFGNPTYAPDIANMLLGIWFRLEGEGEPTPEQAGIYHMSGSGSTSWHGFAEAIFEEGAKYGLPKPEVAAIPTSEYPTPAKRPANSRLDCSKLKRVFGLQQPDWRDSTAECVKRLSQMGELG